MKTKKAQGLPISTLLLLIMGIAVVLIVLLGFYLGWDYVFGKLGILPGSDLEAFTKGCEFAATQNLRSDFCSIKDKPVKIDGRSVYTNCDAVKDRLQDIVINIQCDVDVYKTYCKNKCETTEGKFKAFEMYTDGGIKKCSPGDDKTVGSCTFDEAKI
jgi:hypothetical protein